MKILYFDCFSGISGDMTLGALLDLGIDHGQFLSELEKLHLPGYRMTIGKAVKSGITGTDVQVDLCHAHEEQHEHHEAHAHAHEHAHRHHHHHAHDARNLADIEALIDRSSLKQSIKDFSKVVFREIAQAEAKVHGKDISEVHFHEVGAVDSIVDIVGAAICLDMLGVEKVYSSALHDGQGFIECQHGRIPVPVPAVAQMLIGSGIPLVTEAVDTELVTPTGMGIIKCLAADFGAMPDMKISGVGYGMGKRETGRLNALRVFMGTVSDDEDQPAKEVAVLETNIDDMSAELLGFTMEKLLENGALDVFFAPVYMKKNRPGILLTVLAEKQNEKKLVDLILKETTTLGVRRTLAQRYCMERRTVKVETGHGEVRIKIAETDGIRKYSPEYEDCRDIAQKAGIPLREVYLRAMDSFEKAQDRSCRR